jgi:hypothetical protein
MKYMINPALVDSYLRIKDKGLLLVEQPDAFLTNSYSCTVSGNWFEHFEPLCNRFAGFSSVLRAGKET